MLNIERHVLYSNRVIKYQVLLEDINIPSLGAAIAFVGCCLSRKSHLYFGHEQMLYSYNIHSQPSIASNTIMAITVLTR